MVQNNGNCVSQLIYHLMEFIVIYTVAICDLNELIENYPEDNWFDHMELENDPPTTSYILLQSLKIHYIPKIFLWEH